MELHRNAKLGLSGRFALVQARESGLSVREVANEPSVLMVAAGTMSVLSSAVLFEQFSCKKSETSCTLVWPKDT